MTNLKLNGPSNQAIYNSEQRYDNNLIYKGSNSGTVSNNRSDVQSQPVPLMSNQSLMYPNHNQRGFAP